MKEINYMAEACKKLQLPQGWRWLKIREKTRVGDVRCDPRMPEALIRVECGGDQLTRYHHPVRRCMDGSVAWTEALKMYGRKR